MLFLFVVLVLVLVLVVLLLFCCCFLLCLLLLLLLCCFDGGAEGGVLQFCANEAPDRPPLQLLCQPAAIRISFTATPQNLLGLPRTLWTAAHTNLDCHPTQTKPPPRHNTHPTPQTRPARPAHSQEKMDVTRLPGHPWKNDRNCVGFRRNITRNSSGKSIKKHSKNKPKNKEKIMFAAEGGVRAVKVLKSVLPCCVKCLAVL